MNSSWGNQYSDGILGLPKNLFKDPRALQDLMQRPALVPGTAIDVGAAAGSLLTIEDQDVPTSPSHDLMELEAAGILANWRI